MLCATFRNFFLSLEVHCFGLLTFSVHETRFFSNMKGHAYGGFRHCATFSKQKLSGKKRVFVIFSVKKKFSLTSPRKHRSATEHLHHHLLPPCPSWLRLAGRPWIVERQKTLLRASTSDNRRAFSSSRTALSQVFLGLPGGLFPVTLKLCAALIGWVSFRRTTCPNHLRILVSRHSITSGCIPSLLSSSDGRRSTRRTPHIILTILRSVLCNRSFRLVVKLQVSHE